MVEFALLMPVLVLSIWGCVDFGRWEQVRVAVQNADRIATRFAVTNPTSWSSAASPPSSSIEGQLQQYAQGATITNDDTHITIAYYDTTTSTPTLCGQYSVSSAAFVAQGSYTQATCVIPGSLIKVSVTYIFRPSTPGISKLMPSVTLTDSSQMVEEQ
jgi:Flp pilus assembly protein TadG